MRHLLKKRRAAAFSLIEVSLSLAVVGVGFVSLLGLLGNGLSQYRESIDATVTSQLAQRVINDAQQADFSTLVDAKAIANVAPSPDFSFRAPSLNAPAFRYFDAQGTEIIPEAAGGLSERERTRATYQVNVRIRPFADLPRVAQAKAPSLAQLTIQVVHLHGSTTLDVEPEDGPRHHLFKVPSGIPVYTYATLVGRNE